MDKHVGLKSCGCKVHYWLEEYYDEPDQYVEEHIYRCETHQAERDREQREYEKWVAEFKKKPRADINFVPRHLAKALNNQVRSSWPPLLMGVWVEDEKQTTEEK